MVEVTLSGKQEEKDQTRFEFVGHRRQPGRPRRLAMDGHEHLPWQFRSRTKPAADCFRPGRPAADRFRRDRLDRRRVSNRPRPEAPGPIAIEEVQRQVSSCPVIFAWNGRTYEFITDVLGVGGIGFATGRGTYARAARAKTCCCLPVCRRPTEASCG